MMLPPTKIIHPFDKRPPIPARPLDGSVHVRHLAWLALRDPAGQLAGLLHPSGELSFVELVVLVKLFAVSGAGG
jgi:hypothetical protein